MLQNKPAKSKGLLFFAHPKKVRRSADVEAEVTFRHMRLLELVCGVHRPMLPACSIYPGAGTAGMRQSKVGYNSAQTS